MWSLNRLSSRQTEATDGGFGFQAAMGLILYSLYSIAECSLLTYRLPDGTLRRRATGGAFSSAECAKRAVLVGALGDHQQDRLAADLIRLSRLRVRLRR
jgi:hypothetical protein